VSESVFGLKICEEVFELRL